MAHDLANMENGKTQGKRGHVTKLHFGRLKEVVHARRELFAEIPANTSIEDIMKPEYWAHYSRELKALDIIEAFCDDGTWECSLRVMYVSPSEVKVALRSKVMYDAEEVETTETDTHEIRWKGPVAKYAIVRRDNNEVVESKLYPKSEAAAALRRHLQQIHA